MNFLEKYSRFSQVLLDWSRFQHIKKEDREDIVLTARMIFDDNDQLSDEDFDILQDILAEKYLKEDK